MRSPSDSEIRGVLINLFTDAFNRSITALEDAGAIDTRKMRKEYRGIGSKHYDLVTAQMERTALAGASAIRELFERRQAEDRDLKHDRMTPNT